MFIYTLVSDAMKKVAEKWGVDERLVRLFIKGVEYSKDLKNINATLELLGMTEGGEIEFSVRDYMDVVNLQEVDGSWTEKILMQTAFEKN